MKKALRWFAILVGIAFAPVIVPVVAVAFIAFAFGVLLVGIAHGWHEDGDDEFMPLD